MSDVPDETEAAWVRRFSGITHAQAEALMSDVPDGMVTDAPVWQASGRAVWDDGWSMKVVGPDGDWVDVGDHRAEVLRLRKQIWQLMQDVADARKQRDQLYKITRRAVRVAELLDNMRP